MLAYLFVLLAVVVRLMPHPLAFTPVTGALLYFGARGPRRQFWVPLALLAASDIVLTKITYGYPLTLDHVVSLLWYAAIVWLGTKLRNHVRPVTVIGAALAGSVSFFVISNFGSWLVWTNMYPRTLGGLTACYVAGLPYFRRALEGDLLFTCSMFALPVVLRALSSLLDRSGDHTAAA